MVCFIAKYTLSILKKKEQLLLLYSIMRERKPDFTKIQKTCTFNNIGSYDKTKKPIARTKSKDADGFLQSSFTKSLII